MSTTSSSDEFKKLIDEDTIEWHRLLKTGLRNF